MRSGPYETHFSFQHLIDQLWLLNIELRVFGFKHCRNVQVKFVKFCHWT